MTRSEDVPQTCRTAALFVQNQQSINLFRPVREELHSSGWRVRIFRYDEFEDRDGEAESFELAVQGAASCGRERLRMPAWTVADDCLDESPVSRAWLRVALNASWLTGWEQFVRHRRLLSAQRPNVVISYSVDAVALGLQAAAESLGIPSLFINHGSLGPTLSPWFFQWTALALAGRPCVDAHVVGPFGQRNKGLVPVGYPPYDAMLAEVAERGSTRPTLGDLAQPMGRPHIIVAFVEYGHQFWVHVLQRRLLRMVAECLPPDCFLVCKLHPAGEHEREPCEKLLSSLLAADAFEVIGERQYTTPQLLAGCHVAVAIERCGALTDAILMGRPAVGLRVAEIPPGSSNLSHVALLPQFWRCCRVVDDGTGMRDALLTLTRDRAAGEALWENRREYIESMFLASDGRASQRVADLIRHLGRGKGAEGFVPAIGASLLEERDDA